MVTGGFTAAIAAGGPTVGCCCVTGPVAAVAAVVGGAAGCALAVLAGCTSADDIATVGFAWGRKR